MKDYEDFKNDLGERESSNNYQCENDFGYLGRYQFGKPRLWDLGYSIDGWHPLLRGRKKNISKEDFLNNPQLQDEIFYNHVKDLVIRIRKNYLKYYGGWYIPEAEEVILWNQMILPSEDSILLTESGMVAGAHLKGMGGLNKFLKGKDNADALGTKISEYVKRFGGYDLSNIGLKITLDKEALKVRR